MRARGCKCEFIQTEASYSGVIAGTLLGNRRVIVVVSILESLHAAALHGFNRCIAEKLLAEFKAEISRLGSTVAIPVGTTYSVSGPID